MKRSIGLYLIIIIVASFFVPIVWAKVIKPKYNEAFDCELPENFDYAYSRLSVYNPSIDTTTVIKITTTANKFSLTDKLEVFKWGIGQILVESGGSHYYREGSPKAGKLIVSSGGAIGIAQILPSTAFGYLTTRAKEIDRKILEDLGCDDITFLSDKDMSKQNKIKRIKEWLKNETNNIAIWGFITKNNLSRKKNVMAAMATYNMGDGGIKSYLASGQTIQNSNYIIAIKQKIDYVEKKINY